MKKAALNRGGRIRRATQKPRMTLQIVMGSLLAAFYLWRNTIFTLYVPEGILAFASYLLVLGCFALGTLTIPSVRVAGLLFLVLCLPGTLLSEDRHLIWKKALGWIGLVSVVGPVLISPYLSRLREAAWRVTLISLLLMAMASVPWYFAGGPSMMEGTFTGITNHSMLVGPFSGLVIITSVSKALGATRRARACYIVASLSTIPLLASGSRAALIATMVGAIVAFGIARRKVALILPLAIASYIGLHSMAHLGLPEQVKAPKVTAMLVSKGVENSRQELWQARLEEFRAHPLIGIGIATAEGSGVERDNVGSINVEPGSSYLALLSMTGIAGAMGLLILISSVTAQYHRVQVRSPPGQSPLFAGFGAFFAVHAVAEGWLLAVGSPLSFVFWLWMGHLCDVLGNYETRCISNSSPQRPLEHRHLTSASGSHLLAEHP